MAHVKVVATKKHVVFEDVGSKGLNRLQSPETNITANAPENHGGKRGQAFSFWVWRPNCQGRTVGFREGISYDFKMLMLKPVDLEFISSNATRLNINFNPYILQTN